MSETDQKPPIRVPAAIAWPAGEDELGRVRAARGCPAPEVLCGLTDGALWQVARPLARTVRRHCQDCALCRFDGIEWGRALSPWERLVALWRRVPLRLRAVLILVCLFAALNANRAHATNRAMHWRQCPVNGHYYLIGGEYENYAEALRYARRQRAHLAVIRSEVEQVWLRAKFGHLGRRILIGLREVDVHGNWQWVNGEPLRWSYWEAGHPPPPTDQRLRVAYLVTGRWEAMPVPEKPDEEPIQYALLEREADPYSAVEPASLQVIAWLALALALLANVVAVLIERRVMVLRIQVEYPE